jgi:hypothetical protein
MEFLKREKQILSMPGHPRVKSEAISELMKEYAEGDLDRFEDALMMARFEEEWGVGDDEWGFTPENTDSEEEEDEDSIVVCACAPVIEEQVKVDDGKTKDLEKKDNNTTNNENRNENRNDTEVPTLSGHKKRNNGTRVPTLSGHKKRNKKRNNKKRK